MKLEHLITKVKELGIIKSNSDIDKLFINYPIIKDSLPIETNIVKVLEWAYENDELEDFYDDHYDKLIDYSSNRILTCDITQGTYTTTFELYFLESKNKLYYHVITSGIYSDLWGYDDIPKMVDKQSGIDIIPIFKELCDGIYTSYGELDPKELSENGVSIEFY